MSAESKLKLYEQIETPDGPIFVRGLNSIDLLAVTRQRSLKFDELLQGVITIPLGAKTFGGALLLLMSEPEIFSDVVGAACGLPGARVLSWPIGVQVVAFETAVRLSFEASDEIPASPSSSATTNFSTPSTSRLGEIVSASGRASTHSKKLIRGWRGPGPLQGN